MQLVQLTHPQIADLPSHVIPDRYPSILDSFTKVNWLFTADNEVGINTVQKSLTQLILTLEGVRDTHGLRDWLGDIGTM